jgi:hypothetical protein
MKFRAAAFALVLCAPTFTQPANASYNGVIDYSNTRIVPIFRDVNQDYPNWSGYVYSSRIIFTAGHSELTVKENGERIDLSGLPAFVGLPNSKVSKDLKKVPVVKRYLSTTMRYEGGTMGDFAIYVLGEDIGNFKPAKLGTLEIQKELEDERAFVEITGYGEYRDRCKDGDQLPCSAQQPATSQEPRKLRVQVRPYDDFLGLVGYERPQVKGNLLTWGGGKVSPCGGDSGGSVTTTYKGEEIYLSVTPNGMNGYACGAAGYYDGKGGIGYASPIQAHLDILKEAENFVAAALAKEASEKEKAKPTPTPTPLPSASPTPTPTPTPTITPIPSPTPTVIVTAAPITKKTTITCVKGKLVKKVTALKPVCPKGYKKATIRN